jgi:mono/diheme cytochrome c family protein
MKIHETIVRYAVWGALLGATVVLGACQGQPSRSAPVHLNLNMDFQARLDPQTQSAVFPDGRTMRVPPAGTVATSLAADDHHLQSDDHMYRGIAGGQWATALPTGMKLDSDLLDRGQERYDIYCTPCHDSTGSGAGIAVTRGLLVPPSYHEQRLREMPVGYFYSVITHGVRTMMPYAAQIPVEDRWAIAAYVKALQVSQVADVGKVPADVAAQNGWSR